MISKVIDNMPDEVEEEYVQSGKKTNIMIANTDYDWEDPEGRRNLFLLIFTFVLLIFYFLSSVNKFSDF